MQNNTALRPLSFKKGLTDGLPICLGYLSVSFAFGILASEHGLPVWLSVLTAGTNFTSASQFAGLALIISGSSFIELAATTFIINLRYMLMSLSLSQKLSERMSLLERCVLAFGNTDEVFAVAMRQRGDVPARYLAGLILTPYFGWTFGTFLGAFATSLLPDMVRSALGIVVYGMFIAIILPPARKLFSVALVVCVSAGISCALTYLPPFSGLSSGWIIIICTLIAATVGACRRPITLAELERGEAGE